MATTNQSNNKSSTQYKPNYARQAQDWQKQAVQVNNECRPNKLYKPRSYSKPNRPPKAAEDKQTFDRSPFNSSASCPSFQKDFSTDQQQDPDIHTALTFGEPIVVPVLPATGPGKSGRSSSSIKYRQSKIDIDEPKRNFFTRFSTRTLVLFGVGVIAVLVVCAVSVILLATRTLYKIRSAHTNKLIGGSYGGYPYASYNSNPASSYSVNGGYGSSFGNPAVGTNGDFSTNTNYMYQWPTRFDNSPTKNFYENLYNNRNTNNDSVLMNAINNNNQNYANRPPNFENPVNYNDLNNLNPIESGYNNVAPVVGNEINKSERNVFNWLKNVISDSLYGDRAENYVCGKRHIRNTRIMNGKESVAHSWPWAVSISLEGPKDLVPHACGGTLISKRHVLTAAHCVLKTSIYGLVGKPLRNQKKYSNAENMMRVNVGLHDRLSDINPKNVYGVESVKMHSDFDPVTFKNDVAVIRLDRDIDLSSNVGFICLTKATQVVPGDLIYAIGWGYYENSRSKASRFLREVDLVVQSKNTCLIPYVDQDQFCAGNVYSKKDTCNGDSGGPLMKMVNDQWTMMGIVSNGDASCTGTGIYTNVPFYYDWISQNTN